MSSSYFTLRGLAASTLVALLAGGIPATALAKTYKADCTKATDLQKIIDSTVSGDTIEISGICMGNITIRDKALTLKGVGPGPNGITGTAAVTDGLRIERSWGTVIEGLTIHNPRGTGVRIMFHSAVDMLDCEISDSFDGAATGIWTQYSSDLYAERLTLNDNLRGLGANEQSRVWCQECDLNGNVNWAASAWGNSLVTLLDSAVSGDRGLQASEQSYIDLDCFSHDSAHACTLNASAVAGFANFQSTVAFYDAGGFHGELRAWDRSKMWLAGARQQTNPGTNRIDDDSTLRVEPFSGDSQVIGQTTVTGFSNAQFYGGTELSGNLNCDSGGDAWVEGGIDLTNYIISGCDHVP